MKLWFGRRDNPRETVAYWRGEYTRVERERVRARDERNRLRGQVEDLREERDALQYAVETLTRATEVFGVHVPESAPAGDQPCPAGCGHALHGAHTAFGCVARDCDCLYAPILASRRPSTVTPADEFATEAK